MQTIVKYLSAMNCTGCRITLRRVKQTSGRLLPPRVGAMVLCSACGHLMTVREDWTLAEVTLAEVMGVMAHPQFSELRRQQQEICRLMWG